MPSAEYDLASSPPRAMDEAEELEFYKSQIQQLELELQEFQASSKELESELEKELESSEKVHRDLRQKNEALKYEVDEWKTKYKQTKTDANTTQVQLQKEITTLRDGNRNLQMKLRDLEVSNDDFERQERIVKSSLEDVEGKFNIAIERNAMQEVEIHQLEQEREELRIEMQRLKEELSDLKVEAELSHEKYMIAKNATQQPILNPRFASPMPHTPTTPSSMSPTPRPKPSPSRSTFSSPTPPSPPISETSTSSRLSTPQHDSTLTPRPAHYKSLKKRPSVVNKTPSYTNNTASSHRRGASTTTSSTGIPIPPSRSLNQIRGLIGQMERLEKRVQSAKSKMPQPVLKTPTKRPSPRAVSSMHFTPSANVTLRSNRKRPSSTASSLVSSVDGQSTPQAHANGKASRLSYGTSQDSVAESISRPSSRASITSRQSLGGTGLPVPVRPSSRQSMSGINEYCRPSSRTGDYGRPASRNGDFARPSSRASMSGGDYSGIRPSSRTSMSTLSAIPVPEYSTASKPRTSIGVNDEIFATPKRRDSELALKANATQRVPLTPGSGIPRRKSLQVMSGGGRRISSSLMDEYTTDGNMGPPLPRKKKLSGVGED